MIRIAVASAVGLAVLGSAPLMAQDLPKQAVSYADLNLASPAGAAALQRRIDRAADIVCGSADNRDLKESTSVARCRTQALAGARNQALAAVGAAQLAGEARTRVAAR